MYDIGQIIKVENPAITNNVGGTTHVRGIFKVKITDSWHDYETGYRFIGQLINDIDIEQSRKSGTTKYTPEDYKNCPNKNLYNSTLEAYNNFNPAKVYFSENDIIIGRKKHSSMYAFTSKLEHYFA